MHSIDSTGPTGPTDSTQDAHSAPSLRFTAETASDGVVERDVTVGEITGVLWSPAPATAPATAPGSAPVRAPLVLMGHGGGTHKKWPGMVGRARRLVVDGGFHVAVIDAPGHGDRPRTAHDEREIAALYRAREAGEPEGPVVVRYNAHLARRAVPEWRATLDALQELPEIGAGGPVGYFGLNMGTAIGVPLVAADPRITAAVFGLHWPDALAETARRITVPVEFMLQWDDEHIPRASGLALFDAFASAEKTLHANTGRHQELPRFEADSAVRFFTRHLGRTVTDPN
ncbi:alpha/beta hydrolase [Streptomyces sp. NPDC047017]|uniref:dienelactone hydrolase family protein n=1 Tax=Streptomyces sp. NPDC047017 TaxID=3155024 RepID=UPI0033E2CEE9